MESWLVDVKKVRIPRPKFGAGNRCYAYPVEPPKDYFHGEDGHRHDDLKFKAALHGSNLAKATEDLRRALQDKL